MFIYLWYNALLWHHLSKEKDINKNMSLCITIIILHTLCNFFKTWLPVTVYTLLLVSDTNIRIYYELLTTLGQ